jgi:simple sugar transport system ATP-binding protein
MNYSVALETKAISKRFNSVPANDRVDFCLRTGEIHAVLGENGAGKSTLMNIICGLYRPDSGHISIEGQAVRIKSARHAIGLGVGMVHQHFMLVSNLTVAENIMLGAESTRWGVLDRTHAAQKIQTLADDFGLAVDPGAVVGNLSVGIQQRVEIVKALYREAKILVLDEPTAVLTPPEVEKLFRVMRRLSAGGVSIIFISHKLGETMKIADRISVMRRGRLIDTVIPSLTHESELVQLMVGRKLDSNSTRAAREPGEVILEVENLTVIDDRKLEVVRDVSFFVRAGEILGIAGVQGNGQTELVAALNGLCGIAGGVIRLDGKDLASAPKRTCAPTRTAARGLVRKRFSMHPRRVLESGVAHIPEDRRRHGLVQEYSIEDNQVLNIYDRRPYARHLRRNARAVRNLSRSLLKQFDIRMVGPSDVVATLSGGNQQKVILSRELSRDTRLLVANQPTRGLDVGAVEYVHGRLLAMRDRGIAVLLISVELDEIMALCDTIAVMYEGRIAAMQPVEQISREQLGLLMTGA